LLYLSAVIKGEDPVINRKGSVMTAVRRSVLMVVLVVAIIASTVGVASAASPDKPITCRVTRVVKEARSFAFHSILLRVRLQASWCYDGERVNRMKVSCEIEAISRTTINADRCQPQSSPISWKGQPNGGAYAQVSVNFSNCIFRYACWQWAVMNVERWFYADGAVLQDPRGGIDNV
jgi:hypothetical protein